MRRQTTRVLALVAVAALVGCAREAAPEPVRAFAAAGIVEIDLPASSEAEHGPGSSSFTLEPGTRSPRTISLTVLAPGSALHGFRRLDQDGGSGGPEVELRTALRACGSLIEVVCRDQSDVGTPSMTWCERAVAGLRCPTR